MRGLWFLAAVLIVAIGFLPVSGKPDETRRTAKPQMVVPTTVAPQQERKKLADTIWDYSRTKGVARSSYIAAKAEPELMSKLFCYCGCDIAANMTSLLTCFQSIHSAECTICQDEALFAFKLKKAGLSTGEIQKQVDKKFAYLYPFTRESEILKRYKATRTAR